MFGNRAYIWLRIGQYGRAITDFNRAIELGGADARLLRLRGAAFLSKGQYEEALVDLDKAIEMDPDHPSPYRNKARALEGLGRTDQAITHWRDALQRRADWPEAMWNLAWLLATSKDGQLRSGPEAMALARRACKLTEYKQAAAIDALAAAYAETGQFDKAVKMAEDAMNLAEASGQRKLAEAVADRLKLYRAGRPYRR